MVAKIAKYILIIINALAALWLLVCHITSYVDTSAAQSYVNIICFSLPFAIIVNCLLPLFWLIFSKGIKKIGACISIIALIISWNNVQSSIGWHFGGHATSKKDKNQNLNLKIMTYNVHLFDLGEWTKNNNTENKIMDLIKEVDPDILCLQEFYMDAHDNKEPFTERISLLGYPYFQFTQQTSYKKSRIRSDVDKNEMVNVGIAVFSKYPLENKEDVSIDSTSKNYKILSTEVQIDNHEKFNLIVCHLQSSRVGQADINHIEQIKIDKNLQTANEKKTKNIISKLSQSAHLRAKQTNVIDQYMATKNMPIILCGDFNDVPGSYVYNTLSEDLEDPFTKKGWGFSNTYKYIFPTLRIDHILYDPATWETVSYQVIKEPYSDHYPVLVNLNFKK